jgi:hypothetical protein
MKRLLAVSTSVLLLSAVFSIPSATLQAATKTVSGPVAAVSADSLTVKAKDGEVKLVVDAKTTVVGKGMGTKSTKMKDDKKPTQIVDFVKTGDEVSVTYDDTTKHASEVRVTKPAAPPAK